MNDSCKPLPDRGHLQTEQRNSVSAALDTLSISQTLNLIAVEDAGVVDAVRSALGDIEAVIGKAVAALRRGGRLIYLGAGTSGRLGVLDAAECPPTFCTDPGQVVGIIAGGDKALRSSSEGKEDDPEGARQKLERLDVGPDDVVVGLAAGGTTPYVLGGLVIAKKNGAATALVCCVDCSGGGAAAGRAGENGADHIIELPVGPEVVTGSTRMKAGTATKLVLNMISTTTMVQLGKTWGNLMVDLRATNAKLRDRAVRMLTGQCDLDRQGALCLLDEAQGQVKVALVMAQLGLSASQARNKLDAHGGRLRPILGPPR
jgi:N-acetylmuramic acid 6-phosphate etherase